MFLEPTLRRVARHGRRRWRARAACLTDRLISSSAVTAASTRAAALSAAFRASAASFSASSSAASARSTRSAWRESERLRLLDGAFCLAKRLFGGAHRAGGLRGSASFAGRRSGHPEHDAARCRLDAGEELEAGGDSGFVSRPGAMSSAGNAASVFETASSVDDVVGCPARARNRSFL